MKISVTTRNSNNYRNGWNYAESIQTPDKIRAKGLVLARTFQMWGDPRGTEGQALVAAGITMRDGLKHDVMVINTMAGDVFGFDHQTLRPIWVQHLCNPVAGTPQMDMWSVNVGWSFLATPVIDLARGISWHSGMASPDGSYEKATWWLHGLHLLDGSAVCRPLDLGNARYQPPGGLPLQKFSDVQRKQRCGLALDSDRNGVSTLYICAGSFAESAPTNRGYTIAVDVTDPVTPAISCALTSTSRYSGGSPWMSGGAPAISDDGAIFVVNGNGSFDRETEWGESLVKERHTPRAGTTPASLRIEGNCTRFTDTGNVAGSKYQTLPDTSLLPPDVFKRGDNKGGPSNQDPADDMDECSGATIISKRLTGFSRDLVFYSGKGGIGVLADGDNMPNMALADFAPDKVRANVYGKMLAITGFTDGFGYGTPQAMDITPTDLSQLQTTYGGYTHHFHSVALHYQSPTEGCLIYGGGENGAVRCFKIVETSPGKFEMIYMATGTALASPGLPPPGGMPGWQCCGWSDGNMPGTGALACFAPYGNANRNICPGRLVVYRADHFVNGELDVLWDSERWGVQFTFNKFTPGNMINGILDYGTYDAKMIQFV